MSEAARIAQALGGKRAGVGYLVRCPVSSHGKGRGDRNPSLLLRDGEQRLLVKCYAGCENSEVLSELRRNGLLDDSRPPRSRRRSTPVRIKLPPPQEPNADALKLWNAAKPATGTLAEVYLRRHRHITLPLPPSIRFLSTAAMLVGVQRADGTLIAVQRTNLTQAGKKVELSTARLNTGLLGDGAVRLAEAGDVLGLAEGVETALSAMELHGVPVWAVLGAERLSAVAIPDTVRELHIFGDNDKTGREAAKKTAKLHAAKGRRVVVHFPPKEFKDFNDRLVALARRAA